ncbi:MAG: c-type cytochrome [Candidatus Hydrogenedentes bacterium]|nr:c-type cytochrome [Candidatus Hydrogenedentota bacterium]
MSQLVAPTEAPAATPERKFVKLWTVADLEPVLKQDQRPRHFEAGRKIFQETGCTKCHLLKGEGFPIGPDLSKVQEKFKGVELLRQILEPSLKIDPEYTAYLVMKSDYTAVTGFLVEEGKDAITIRDAVFYSEEPLVIPRSEIEALRKAPLSAMPTSLLSTFTAAEILDLLAFVEAGGDPEAAVYKNP